MSATGADGPVLFCYDGSESSATAIAAAGQLLAVREVFVCHAWTGLSRALLHSNPGGLPEALRGPAEQLDEADREAAERVAADGVRLARTAGFDAQPLPVREERKTWRTLLAEAERHRAAVVVAGAHGLSGIGRALLGSVSTALVHHSTRPVLVVPGTAADEAHAGPLLLSYDGSEPAKHAIEIAARLSVRRSALVLNFWESWVAEAPALAAVSRSVHGMAAELDEIADEQSAECTAAGVELARLAGFEAYGLSARASGPAWMAVLDAAAEHDCAGVVVGSRGLTGLSAALGSVSNGVVHHSRRPVLVVPPGAGSP
jgi:nucleotide-binding universal stress UspA family protein